MKSVNHTNHGAGVGAFVLRTCYYDDRVEAPVAETKINEKDGAEMVWVPEGEFVMGNDDGLQREKPLRTVYLDGYWIYKYPVTLEQYAAYCRESGLSLPPKPEWGWRHDHPVVNVSWHDATAYAAWAGVALPTEAQWEKAARGTDGREYPWGETWDPARCQCSRDKYGDAKSTAPVTEYRDGVSPFGAMDMAGNVWEWCDDWYAENYYYKAAPSRNPAGPAAGEYRVLRGGGWYNYDGGYFRCAYRDGDGPDVVNGGIGFRCASRAGLS
jgi:sulfatase modifying factor 1